MTTNKNKRKVIIKAIIIVVMTKIMAIVIITLTRVLIIGITALIMAFLTIKQRK